MGKKKKKDGIKRFEPVFGKWHVAQKIGQGSYGTVYKIYRKEHGKKVYSALKHIHIGPTSGSDLLLERKDAYQYYRSVFDDALRRVELAHSLKGHPNIVPIEEYSYTVSKNECCWDMLIRMEMLTPIEDHYAKHPPSERDIQKLGIDICSALEACESKNIAHLDVRPNNIYINGVGDYLLGDFGIAKIINGERNQTTLILDELDAAVPEDAYIRSPRLLSADLYSLGMVLYQYLNDNKAPFVSYNEAPYTYSMRERAIRQRLSGEEIPPPRNAGPDFAKVILRAMAFLPVERFLSATDMKFALVGISHVSSLPLWTEDSRVSHTIQGDGDFSSPSRDGVAREAKHAADQAEKGNTNERMSEFKTHRTHRISFSDKARKRTRRILNWVLFTCILSLIPLLIFLLLRWIFVANIPVEDKLAIELLYFGLTLAIVSLRELIRYDSRKKQSVVFQPALWLTIVDLFLSAMLFSVMTANELQLFSEPVQSAKMLLAAVILSGTSFVLGTAIQYWEDI